MNGLDGLIMYGVGTTIGHCSMALRIDGELYIVESHGSKARPTQGIVKNKFADWLQQMRDGDFFASWVPLKAEIREKFNEQAAIDFFNAHEGDQYGNSNFLYGWLDTANDNWPPLLPRALAPVLFSVIDKLDHEFAYQSFTEGMVHRLGGDFTTVPGATAAAAAQNMSLDEAIAIPEQDGWIYESLNPTSESYVCSAFVAALYKAAGLFGDLEINATEFTPRNVVELNFWDLDRERPQACIDADPDLRWCQLNGTHRMPLQYANTVEPYEHMNERCAINWPTYFKDDGC